MKIGEIFNDELTGGIPFFSGGRTDVEFEVLSEPEETAISKMVRRHANMLQYTSPILARSLLQQENAIVKMAAVVKALFPTEKVVKHPGTQNSIVADIITPQALFWKNTADTSNPCYTGYEDNSWDINLTAGVPAYLFGDGTNYYEARKDNNNYMAAMLLHNGLFEVGTAPKISHMHVKTKQMDLYAPTALSPMVDLAVDPDRPVYIYNTPGIIPLTHDVGTEVSVMPQMSGVSNLRWLGVVFYEYNHMGTLTECRRS
ncbi:MAG: hypothetical protein WCR85_00245 [Sphaerochaeta sp.]